MPDKKNKVKLISTGTGLRGAGYPNSWNVLRILSMKSGLQVQDQTRWLPTDFRLWKMSNLSFLRHLFMLSNLAIRDLISLFCLLRQRFDVILVPYPYISSLLFLSLLPRSLRPAVIVDVYNSLWISFAGDRYPDRRLKLFSRIIRAAERKALNTAGILMVDTEANAVIVSKEFSVAPERIRSAPLALDPIWYKTPGKEFHLEQSQPLKVIFFGTLIPLHGIDVISNAISKFSETDNIYFELIGTGQEEVYFRKLSTKLSFVHWTKRWLEPEELLERLQSADITLGVFGGAGKASRVLPWKIYISLACGLPVITQTLLSTPSGCPRPPCYFVDDANGIARAIRHFDADRTALSEFSRKGCEYFEDWLNEEHVAKAWESAIKDALAIRP